MSQNLFLDGRVDQAPDQLMGHHLVRVAGGVLAGGDGAFHCEVSNGGLTFEPGCERSAWLLIILAHAEECHNVH